MKLDSGRDKDRQEAGEIIKLVKTRSIKDIINKPKEYSFQPALSLILELFEIAHGMEWLAEYMSEHFEEFKHY